jgi:hypothetical protein
MRYTVGLSLAVVVLASACNGLTGNNDPGEGAMNCHGVNKGNRCVEFPPNPQIAKLVAAMPILRQDAPLTQVRCYSKETLAVCDGTLKHGSLAVQNAPFRIHTDGSVTPVCPSKPGKRSVSVFCVD